MQVILNDYLMIEGAIEYLEQGIRSGYIPAHAGAKGLVWLRAESARLFALLNA